MSIRDQILGRLDAALKNTNCQPLYAEHEDRSVVTEYYQYTPEQRVERLTKMMQASHSEVHQVSEKNWPAKLLDLMQAKQLNNLVIGDNTPHGQQLTNHWKEFDETPDLKSCQRDIEQWKDELFHNTDAALTGSRGGIAATGSIIVWPTPEEPRLISLVPPVHFILLRASTIHNSFAEVMALEKWQQGLPTNALLISGPSKTADIQLTLAYGAHGPRELIVLIVNDMETR